MIITKACLNDIDNILKIANQAIAYFKNAHINQWQDGYPNKEVFLNDINNNSLYVVKEEEKVAAIFALYGHEDSYNTIYDGAWHSDNNYAVIHRIALADEYKGKGVAKLIIDFVKEKYSYIRIDTHKDNVSMQRCLHKNGFKYCGIIHLSRDGEERLAFDYLNDKK